MGNTPSEEAITAYVGEVMFCRATVSADGELSIETDEETWTFTPEQSAAIAERIRGAQTAW